MVEKEAAPNALLGLSWGKTQAAVLAGLQGRSALLVTLGVRGCPGSRSGTSILNSHISYSHMSQGPFMWPRCPQEGEGGRRDPDLARNGVWHQGPRCRCATSVGSRLSARAAFLPLPSPLHPSSRSSRSNQAGERGCHRGGGGCTCRTRVGGSCSLGARTQVGLRPPALTCR